MSVARFLDVLLQMKAATVNAINAANITTPAQVGIGWPVSTELVKILNAGQYQVTLFDRKNTMRSTARFPSQQLFQIDNPVTTLAASVANPSGLGHPWVITFSGSVGAGAFVAVNVGSPVVAATYTPALTDSLANVATAVAAAINALGISTASATASGATVSVSKSPICDVKLCGTGYVLASEVNRIARSVQLSIWCPNPQLRWQVADAIEASVGTFDQPFLTLSDGTQALCTLSGGSGSELDDQSQSSYSLYIEHLIFDVEYSILKTYTGYPIEVVEPTITVNADAPLTVVS